MLPTVVMVLTENTGLMVPTEAPLHLQGFPFLLSFPYGPLERELQLLQGQHLQPLVHFLYHRAIPLFTQHHFNPLRNKTTEFPPLPRQEPTNRQTWSKGLEAQLLVNANVLACVGLHHFLRVQVLGCGEDCQVRGSYPRYDFGTQLISRHRIDTCVKK